MMNKTWTKPDIDIAFFDDEELVVSSPAAIDQIKADIEGGEGQFKNDWLNF